jgi:DNA polymerase
MQLAKTNPAATMPPMSAAFDQLLDATIQHLENLKTQGVRHVSISPDVLHALTQPSPRPPQPKPTQQVPAGARPSPGSPPAFQPANRKPQSAIAQPASEMSLPLALPGEASAPATAPPLNREAKTAAFAELRERALACVKCSHLAASRKNVVFGVGSIDAELMFVGEAPGADEDLQAEPFVGKAGQLLTKIIETMGLRRSDVYIANILKCRPDTPGQTAGNRKPTTEEMQTCIPYLHEPIDLIRPKVIVALAGRQWKDCSARPLGL